MLFALQTIPLVAAVSVLVATVLYFVLQAAAGEKKKNLPITLQDPMVKYGLRLINKQVNSKQTPMLTKRLCTIPTKTFMTLIDIIIQQLKCHFVNVIL